MGLEILLTNVETEKPENLKRIIMALQVLAGESPIANHCVANITVSGPTEQEMVDMIADNIKGKPDVIGGVYNTGKPEASPAEQAEAAGQALKSAAEAFAQSTAGAEVSQTAPVVTAETTSITNESGQPPSAPNATSTDAQAGAATSNPAPDVDSEGLAWDVRIHSEGRTKIANGTWRLKKGVHPDTIALVKSEQGLAVKPAASAPPPPPDTVAAGAPPAPPTTDTPASSAPLSWLDTVMRSTKGVTDGKWKSEDLAKLFTGTFGVPNVGALNEKPDELAKLNAIFDEWEANGVSF